VPSSSYNIGSKHLNSNASIRSMVIMTGLVVAGPGTAIGLTTLAPQLAMAATQTPLRGTFSMHVPGVGSTCTAER
jgi:hypothetical protein